MSAKFDLSNALDRRGEDLRRGYFFRVPETLVSASSNPNSSRSSEAMRRNARRSSMVRAPAVCEGVKTGAAVASGEFC